MTDCFPSDATGPTKAEGIARRRVLTRATGLVWVACAGGALTGAPRAHAQQWPYWSGTREEREQRSRERQERRAAERRAREQAKSWDTSLPGGAATLETLAALPWIASGTRGGPVLYEVSFRNCPPCMIFARDGAGQLGRIGIEVRTIMFAPTPSMGTVGQGAGAGELATLAALYRTRDHALLHDWFHYRPQEGFAASRGLPQVEPGSADLARINEVRTAVRTIVRTLETTRGLSTGYPSFFWNDPRRGARYAMGWTRGVPAALQTLAETNTASATR